MTEKDAGDAGASSASMAGLDAALAKVRHQTASQLESQRRHAQLLVAIESTLDEQHESKRKRLATERSPTEYLVALLSMLNSKAATNDGVLGSTLYLLAIVAPQVQPATLLSQLGVLTPTLSKVLGSAATVTSSEGDGDSLTLRSALSILEALLVAHAHTSTLASLKKNIVITGCWNTAVQLALDVRPKIRRRAHDLITATLNASHNHPYAASTAEWAVSRLESIITSGGLGSRQGGAKGKKASAQQQRATDFSFDKKSGQARNAGAFAAMRAQALQQGLGQALAQGSVGGTSAAADAAASAGIWLCQLLKRIVKTFPRDNLTPLAAVLLRLPALQNPFLTSAVFEVFDALLRTTSSSGGVGDTATGVELVTKDTLSQTLQALLDPAILPSDNQSLSPALLSAYLRALTGALTAYSRYLLVNPDNTQQEEAPLPWATVVPAIWGIAVARALDAKTAGPNIPKQAAVRQSAAEALVTCLRYGTPDSEVNLALDYVVSHRRHLAFAQQSSGSKGDDRPFLVRVVSQLHDALGKHALRFANVVPELLDVIVALVRRLGQRTAQPPKKKVKTDAGQRRPAANELVLPTLLPTVAELRSSPAFPARENADAVIAAAIQVVGPRAVLAKLPLGLLGENPDGQGRAWLLPLMRSSISNTELLHFVDELIPLSEKLFARKEEAISKAEGPESGHLDPKQKQRLNVEAKMYEALVDQVWATFPAYCELPYDLGIVLRDKPEVIALVSSLLFSQPSLRPTVTRGLQRLVERNTALARSAAPKGSTKADFGIDQDEAKVNVELLAKLAYQDTLTSVGNGGLLANLMNVYSQAAADARGFLLETIATFVEILPQEQVDKMYTRIVKMLKKSLPSLVKDGGTSSAGGAGAPVPHTMLDLLGALIPFIKPADATDLFALLQQDDEKTQLLKSSDAGVQKRTYKLLTRLVELRAQDVLARSGTSDGPAAKLVHTLNTLTPSVLAGSKRGRIALFAALIPFIGSDELHLLPHIVPEAVLATKETNQQCREESYELLVQMGHKMAGAQGRVIKRDLAGEEGDEDMAEGSAPQGQTTADLTEYLTMVSAGLAGKSPHMISATITALARLVYEFHEDIPNDTLEELLSTLLVFLASANREIVKSCLGMVKVVIVTYPSELVDKHLAQIVELLLNGKSAQHKQHFKSKLRHIVERLMRKFGNERIEQLADEENRKLVVNIRKRKERAKRKKAGAGADGHAGHDDDDEEHGHAAGGRLQSGVRATKSVGVDAFEEALYGSDSDLSSDDDGDTGGPVNGQGGAGRKARPGKKHKDHDHTYILEDGEEDDAMPLDLLDRTALASKVASANPVKADQRRRRPGQEASKFDIEEGTGKMVIDDDDDGERDGAQGLSEQAKLDAEAGAGTAFLRKQRGVDGFTVGKGGAVKFNKNNKRTREDEMELDDQAADEGGDQDADATNDPRRAAAIFAAAAAGESTTAAASSKKKQRKEKVPIGAEFRSKRAGGDVSKNGQSPFAYVPLGQVANKKKGKHGKGEDGSRLDITGKGKRGRA